MINKIHPLYFIIAFTVGLFFCYLTHPKPSVVMRFPSPYNAGQVVYKNQDESCYKYKAERVSCPVDKGLIKPQPVAVD